MKTLRRYTLALALALAAAFGAAQAQGQAPAQETLRLELLPAVQAAQTALAESRFQEALAKVKEAEAIPGRTPYENFVLDQLRGAAATGAGDAATAVRSFAAVIDSRRLAPAEQLRLIEGLVGTTYRLKAFTETVAWARRYLADGGSNPSVRRLLAVTLIQQGDAVAGRSELLTWLSLEEEAGRVPGEESLRLLAATNARLGDDAGYAASLERLLRHHPSVAYWRDRIARLQRDPAFERAALIDSYRLLAAVEAMTEATEYRSYAELALGEGLPAEARRVLRAGFEAGRLGAGAEAAADQALRNRAERLATADERELDNDPSPGAKAEVLAAHGMGNLSAGRLDAGLAWMERALARPELRRADLVRLRMGAALAMAARAEQARAVLGTLESAPASSAQLARLWLLHLQRPAGRAAGAPR
jgi:hypothetical protein